MNMINEYLEQIKLFEEVSPKKAESLLENEGAVVYIGRKTCPYCRLFVSKLSKVVAEKNYKVYLVDSESKVFDFNDIQAFRQQFNIPTVPGFIVHNREGVNVRCDSSMSEAAIVEMIEA